ncbi:hypothetical protein, partial [Klebsiella pneumoniae]|uniref:hypothetical protein n=1 Tax=Klebsiella pneumoniae TaxID=573 RepID=UPI003EDEF2B7
MILGLPLVQFLFFAVNLLVMAGGFGYIVHASLIYRKPAITDEQATAELKKVEQKVVQTGDEVITI